MGYVGSDAQLLVLISIYLCLCEAAQVGHSLPSVCVCVCMYVCSHHHSSTNEGRMLKLGTNIHTHKLWYVFEVKRSKVKVTRSISAKNHVSGHNVSSCCYQSNIWVQVCISPECSLVIDCLHDSTYVYKQTSGLDHGKKY